PCDQWFSSRRPGSLQPLWCRCVLVAACAISFNKPVCLVQAIYHAEYIMSDHESLCFTAIGHKSPKPSCSGRRKDTTAFLRANVRQYTSLWMSVNALIRVSDSSVLQRCLALLVALLGSR